MYGNQEAFDKKYPPSKRKVRYLNHNEYQQYLDRKLAHYNEWLCNPKRPLGVAYEGFNEDMEFNTMMTAMENMAATLVNEQVIPKDAIPRGKVKVAKAVKAPAARKAKSGTKQEAAVAIFKRLNGDKASTITAIMDELGMSTAGATTYFYNAKKLA